MDLQSLYEGYVTHSKRCAWRQSKVSEQKRKIQKLEFYKNVSDKTKLSAITELEKRRTELLFSLLRMKNYLNESFEKLPNLTPEDIGNLSGD